MGDATSETLGRIAWFEVPAEDTGRARQFYGELFGWRFEPSEGDDYHLTYDAGGAVYQAPAQSGPTVYFGTADIDGAIARVRSLGGEAGERQGRPLPGRRTMTRVLVVAAAVGLFAALTTGASAGGAREVAAGERCSASSLPAGRPAAGLPPAVASLRLRIVAAARRCDYAGLVRLGDEVGRGLQFSYGGTMSAPRFWRTLEAGAGPPPRPMEALVKLLAMPAVPVDLAGRKVDPRRARFYVWPPAHRQNASASDWQALRSLYTPAQIERMQRGRSYLGYRVGITPCGDWQFFVAGD